MLQILKKKSVFGILGISALGIRIYCESHRTFRCFVHKWDVLTENYRANSLDPDQGPELYDDSVFCFKLCRISACQVYQDQWPSDSGEDFFFFFIVLTIYCMVAILVM